MIYILIILDRFESIANLPYSFFHCTVVFNFTCAEEGSLIKLAIALNSLPPLRVNFLVHTRTPLKQDNTLQFFTLPTGNGYKKEVHACYNTELTNFHI